MSQGNPSQSGPSKSSQPVATPAPQGAPEAFQQQMDAGRANLSRQSGKALSQMAPHEVTARMGSVLGELAAILEWIVQHIQQPPQPTPGP